MHLAPASRTWLKMLQFHNRISYLGFQDTELPIMVSVEKDTMHGRLLQAISTGWPEVYFPEV